MARCNANPVGGYRSVVQTGRSNAVLITDLLSQDGPHARVADDFVRAACAQCGQPLNHDPRYGEWGAYCARCNVDLHGA